MTTKETKEKQVSQDKILVVKGLKKYFGGTQAIDNVSFEVRDGEMLGIIGPNGAGKTTLFNLLTGFLTPDEGEVFFKGKKITGKKPHEISRLGITRVFQIVSGLETLTIKENVQIGARNQTGENLASVFFKPAAVGTEQKGLEKKSLDLLDTVKLSGRSEEYPGELDAGGLKKLEFVRGRLFDPDLFFLDEPLSGMSPEGMENVCQTLVNLNQTTGKTLIMVEHNVRYVMRIAKRVIVLDRGRIIADGTPKEIMSNKEVIKVYLGEKFK